MSKFPIVKACMIYESIIDGTHDSPKTKNEGFKLVTSKNIKNDQLDLSTANFISKEDYDKINLRSKVEKWDLIISMIGEYCGYTYVEKDDKIEYAIKNVGVYRTKSKIEAYWLKYYLKSDLGVYYLKQGRSGSSQPYISLGNLRNLPILNPDSFSKKEIVSVLSALDDKIELNNKINTELEAIAKTLYDYWFVQFDFPDADGKPYKSSGGEMVYDEVLKREIPKGWEVKSLDKIIIVKDGTHDSPKYIENGFPLVTSKNLKSSGIDFNETNKISETDFKSINLRSKVDKGDILFSMIGSIGTIYKVDEATINFAIKNVALFKTSQKDYLRNYIYQYLHSYDMQRYIPNVISGSIQKFIGLTSLRQTPVLYNEKLIALFNENTKAIYSKMQTGVKQNQELASLRDWLLPMLMNGQVTVAGAYKEVEEKLAMVADGEAEYNTRNNEL